MNLQTRFDLDVGAEGWEVYPEPAAIALADAVPTSDRIGLRPTPGFDSAVGRGLQLIRRAERTQSACSTSHACRSSIARAWYFNSVEPT